MCACAKPRGCLPAMTSCGSSWLEPGGNMSSDSSESEVEWEEVEPLQAAGGESTEPLMLDGSQGQESGVSAGAGGLEIVLQGAALLGKGKRKSQQSMFERAVATFNRELRYSLHKVHLLCLVAHGLQLSRQCACPVLQAVLLSMVPRELCCLKTHPLSRESLQKLLRWFSAESVTLRKTVEASCPEFCCSVVSQLLVALLTAVGLRARVVLVLEPVPFKAAGKKPQSRDGGEEIAKMSSLGVIKDIRTRSRSSSVLEIVDDLSTVVKVNSDRNLNPRDVKLEVNRDALTETSIQSKEDEMRTKARKRGASPLPVDSQVPTSSKKRRTSANSRPTNSSNCDQELESVETGDTACSSKSARKRKGKGRGRRGSETVSSAPSCKSSPYFKKRGKPRKLARGRRGGSESASDHSRSSDEDFVPQTKLSRFSSAEKTGEVASGEGSCSDSSETETRVRKKGKSKLSKGKGSKSTMSLAKKIKAAAEGVSGSSPGREDEGEQSRRQQSSGADEKAGGESALKKGALYDDTTSWVEVYLQPEQKWVCLHSPSLSVAQPKMCEKHCTGRSISYVIAVEKACVVRDVTARYAHDWCTKGRNRRLSEEWWAELLGQYAPSKEERQEETADILSMLYSQPLPTSVSDYKNHPLYALRRYLLKFEAVYPDESRILGYCKGEPVYARECVHPLHTRETWLKEGRVVKKAEEPYSIVKARPKKGQSVLEVQNSTVEVFGKWQTEDYVPPPVVDGKVPRNEYGNVELFQPSMLPPGACHLRIPGIQRVARRLGVDYAPAMMGWDFHGGYCHPILDGIVVAEECEDLLRDAWEVEAQVQVEKEGRKREERALQRWRKLTKALLIRERVQKRYST